jgi:hypothetical protein
MESGKSNDGIRAAVSDGVLRSIAEQGFFAAPGTLADARSACAELLFARAIIEAQTAKIKQLCDASRRPGCDQAPSALLSAATSSAH